MSDRNPKVTMAARDPVASRLSTIDEVDARLLDALQREVPLVARPFEVIGRRTGLGEAEVLNRLAVLASPPRSVIRQISAIFDSAALGYRSCLVAAKVPPPLIDMAVAAINAHPGV